MLLSKFIKYLEMINHPNVEELLPLLKENLTQYGDVHIDLDVMLNKMEIQ